MKDVAGGVCRGLEQRVVLSVGARATQRGANRVRREHLWGKGAVMSTCMRGRVQRGADRVGDHQRSSACHQRLISVSSVVISESSASHTVEMPRRLAMRDARVDLPEPEVPPKRRMTHLPSSVVIDGHQSSSTVINGHQRSSEVINGHQGSSGVIRDHQGSSEVIRGNQGSSGVIRGHQRSSVVIPFVAPRSRSVAMRDHPRQTGRHQW